MENWKSVVGYEDYEVSDLGRVRSVERQQSSYGGRTWTKRASDMKLTSDGRYLVVTLVKNKKRKRLYVHEIVLTTFVGERPTLKHHACHGDGNGLNDVLSNLRWDTPAANVEDKRHHGTMPIGEDHWKNKYSEKDILRVKELIAEKLNATEIEKMTGVQRNTVAAIRSGRQWAHLK